MDTPFEGALTKRLQSAIISSASNVILTKARAMYGKSLKMKDFRNLIGCHSVGEVASYLKNTPSYSSVFSGINETTIHRGHLELLLRRKLFEDYVALGRYDAVAGMQSFDYLLVKSEIELIISCLRLINAGSAEDILFAMPMFFASHTRLNLHAMTKCRTFSEMLSALEHTRYYKLLSGFTPNSDGQIPLTETETALYTELTNISFGIISRSHGSVRQEMQELLGTQVDAQNINRILRLKKYFNMPADKIRQHLLPSGMLSPRIINSMIEAQSSEEIINIFLSTKLGRRLPQSQRMSIYDLHQRIPYFNARRYIHYSSQE